jgi:Ca-activated chloride channel family protein
MSAALADVHMLRPLWLLALLPALGLFLLERRTADAGARWAGRIDPELLEHLVVGGETRRVVTPNLVLLVAWIIAAIAAAGPAWQREPSPFADAKSPVVVVLKVTPSMKAADLAPTRLDRARQKLADLLALREGAMTGLVAYAGSAHLVLPPTADTAVVTAMAGALDPAIMPKEGDDLEGALQLAHRALAGTGRAGSILVVTDSVSPAAVAELAPGEDEVTVLAVAPEPMVEADDGLADAARAIDATVVPTTVDQSDLAKLAARLDRAGELRAVAGEGSRWKDAGIWLTPLLALIVLCWFRRGFVLA